MDVHVERARIAQIVGIPYLLHQKGPRQNFTRVLHKNLEQVGLPGGEVAFVVTLDYTALLDIESYAVTRPEHLVFSFVQEPTRIRSALRKMLPVIAGASGRNPHPDLESG